MNRFDDARLDATLQTFLGARAADTGAIRDAHDMTNAIARLDSRSGGRAVALRLAWAMVVLALLGALAVGTAFLGGLQQTDPLEARTVPTASATPRPAATPTDEPTLTSSPAPPIGDGPTLIWSRVDVDEFERVAWLGGRFYLGGFGLDVLESEDGQAWRQVGDDEPAAAYGRILHWSQPFASWEGDVIQWDPDAADPVVRIVQPPAAIVESRGLDQHDKDIGDVAYAAGIGPAGVVAAVATGFDYEGFALRVLGQDWVDQLSSYGLEGRTVVFRTHDGRRAEFPLSDLGLSRYDLEHASSAWYSPDGQSWTRLSAYHAFLGVSESNVAASIAGITDGFLLQHPNGSMWHSPDGRSWSRLADGYRVGIPGWSAGSLLPWGSGALATDGANRFDLWTAEGRSTLPMVAGLPERDPRWERTAAGPLGIVVVDPEHADVLFSPDGTAWSVAPMPPEMARFAPDSAASKQPTVAVGSAAVMVVLWDDQEGSSVWRGTVAP